MMEASNEFRKLPFAVAYVLLLLIVAYEAGSTLTAFSGMVMLAGGTIPKSATNNLAIPSLWLVDCVLLMSMSWMGASIFLPGRGLLKVQGIGSLIFGGFLITTGIAQWSVFLGRLFGFLLEFFSSRQTDPALLAILVLLKILFAVLFLVFNKRLLKVKSLVLIVATSIGLNFLIGFLWSLWLPTPIMDTAAAFICTSVGLGWCVVMMMESLVSVKRLIPTNSARS